MNKPDIYFNHKVVQLQEIDHAVFEKDYVLQDLPEKDRPRDKTDNFTEKIGPSHESIKITKNFMDESSVKLLNDYCEMIYKKGIDDLELKNIVYKIIDEYKEKTILYSQKLFNTKLEYDIVANDSHARSYNLNSRPPGFETSVHTDNFGQINNGYPWTGQISNLIYLNDEYLGGEIYFPQHKLKIKPEKGMMVSFPGNWNNRHGVIPASDFRFALSFFLKISDFVVI